MRYSKTSATLVSSSSTIVSGMLRFLPLRGSKIGSNGLAWVPVIRQIFSGYSMRTPPQCFDQFRQTGAGNYEANGGDYWANSGD